MKVATIFETNVGHTTGWYIYRAFKELGHEVYAIHDSKVNEIADPFDLYFIVDSTKYFDIPKWDKPSIYYGIDTHLDFWNRLNMAKTATHAAFAQFSCGTKQAIENGLPNAYWMPLGCDPWIHEDTIVDRDLDIAFVGTLHGHDTWRTSIKQVLLDHGIPEERMHIGGASHLDIGKIYSRAKICLNHTFGGNGLDINMRVFEGMSGGAYLITDKLKVDDMSKLFQYLNYKEYETQEEMLEQIDHVLANWQDYKLYASIAKRCVREHHTYRQHLQELLIDLGLYHYV